MGGARVNAVFMDWEDSLPRPKSDLVAELSRQSLDPLSIVELDARVAALEAEIARVKAHRDRASHHRHSADSLFKK